MREGRGAFRRPLGDNDVALQIFRPGLVRTPTNQLQAARDGGQQIVEIVRQSTGQLAHGFELLALAQLLARCLQLGGTLFDLPFK